MATIRANGIEITYERFGGEDGIPVLFVHGLGAQLSDWDRDFIAGFTDAGYHVIAFDNRDVGKSSWFDDAGVPDFEALIAGDASSASYLISDMAADAAGLLEALGVGPVHILGVSMGGMIVQQLAIDHPERILSLTSIMSTPDLKSVGQPTDEAITSMMVAPPTSSDEAMDLAVASWKVIGSPGFTMDEGRIRDRAKRSFERAFHPEGTARQMAAIGASEDRRPGLAGVVVPTLVVHGAADPLVTLPGGQATAAAVPGAALWVIDGMGHDLPQAIWGELVARHGALVSATV